MALTLPSLGGGSPISEDLMYKFYDNKAITPQIRAALQKREDSELKDDGESSSSSSSSKFGPAARVDITDNLIRMNIASKTPSMKKEEKLESKPGRYDALTEIKKRVASEEEAKKKEKDEKLQEIADKVAEDEKAKKEAEEAAKENG